MASRSRLGHYIEYIVMYYKQADYDYYAPQAQI